MPDNAAPYYKGGLLSIVGTSPGSIDDILRERRQGPYHPHQRDYFAARQAKRGADNKPQAQAVTIADPVESALAGERFVLADKISKNGHRFITLWFEGDYNNQKVVNALSDDARSQGFPFFRVEAPCDEHPEYTTIGISAQTKEHLLGLRGQGKLVFTEAIRRSDVPAAFEALTNAHSVSRTEGTLMGKGSGASRW